MSKDETIDNSNKNTTISIINESDTHRELQEVNILKQLNDSKDKGNDLFKNKDYQKAIDEYDLCIDLGERHLHSDTTILPPEDVNAIKKILGAVYNNRAFCYFRLEMYGAVIEDASKAIKYLFYKGYYRRGCGYAALMKWNKARKDFEEAKKKLGTNKDIETKLKQSTEAFRFEKFAAAIAVETEKPASETIDLDAIPMPDSSYKGPHLPKTEELTPEWIINLESYYKDMGWKEKEGGKLHIRYAYDLLLRVLQVFKSCKNIEYFDISSDDNNNDNDEHKKNIENSSDGHITVCGDVHGQYYDFLNIFDINGHPSPNNPYLFNGDFVDRGSWSVEVIIIMLCWKLLYPKYFHMTRGNHESINMNLMYGFKGEVEKKYNKKLFDLFTEIFNYLPIGYVLGHQVFVCHGGLFQKDNVTIDELQKIDRVQQPGEHGVMSDLLWSDPQETRGRAESKRGGGIMFGPDITEKFLKLNNLKLLIRSHEVQKEGYHVHHNGKLITIFSAPNYVDQMDNKGAFIKLDKNYEPHFTQFTAVPHPDIKPMAYASGPLGFRNFF